MCTKEITFLFIPAVKKSVRDCHTQIIDQCRENEQSSFLYFISGHWFDDSEPIRLVTLSEDSDFAPEFVLNNADKYDDMLMHKL